MRMTNRRDFIRFFSVVLGAVSPLTPTAAPNPQLARVAEKAAGDLAVGVEGLAASFQGAGEPGLAAAEGTGLRSEITQVGQLLESSIREALNQAAAASSKAGEKNESAKVLSVIAAIVLVVVACVIAAFTFGAGGALIGLAVIAAAAIIGGAVSAAGQVTGKGKIVADQLTALLQLCVARLRNLESAPAADKSRVRKLALTEIASALGGLKASLSSLSQISGECGADPRGHIGLLPARRSNPRDADGLSASVAAQTRRRRRGGDRRPGACPACLWG